MPYNTTAIPPRKEVTGQTLLPLSRVKKIIGVDQDIAICSNNAAFVITLATEMFIQHLTNEAHNMAKAEKKPRRNIQYKDIAHAVSARDNLEFLEDVVPKTTPYSQIKSQAAAQRAKLTGGTAAAAAEAAAANGPGDLEGQANVKKPKLLNGTIENAFAKSRVLAPEGPADPNSQLQMEMEQRQGQGQQLGGEDVDMTG